MATIKAFSDLKQSRKLAEILPIESADMRYGYIAPYDYSDRMYDGGYDEIPYQKDFLIKNPNFFANEYDTELPCWSLAALISLLPSEFIEAGKYSTTIYVIKIRKYKLTDEIDLHQIAYGTYKWHEDGGYTWSDMINTGEKENLIDAVFDMICWLKENNKL